MRIIGFADQTKLQKTKWCGGYVIPRCEHCGCAPSEMRHGALVFEPSGNQFSKIVCEECVRAALEESLCRLARAA